MRSNGVKKWRRRAFGCDFGPSSGNFAFDAAFVKVLTLVVPSRRDVNAYEPATLIGPDRLFTSTRPLALTTWATVKRWRDQLFMCLVLRQRKSWLRPAKSAR